MMKWTRPQGPTNPIASWIGVGLPSVVKRLGGIWIGDEDSGVIPVSQSKAYEIASRLLSEGALVGRHVLEVTPDCLFLRKVGINEERWFFIRLVLRRMIVKKKALEIS